MNVVLGTGSSDLWVADDSCTSCNRSTPLFQSGKSSTVEFSKNSSSRVQLTYGSGRVSGDLARDTISMAGFGIQKQIFGLGLQFFPSHGSLHQSAVAVDDVSDNFLQGSVSGILGLAFPALASARSTSVPFWQALIQTNQLTNPEMSFYLKRLVDDSNAAAEAPGGVFTLGGSNSRLFTGGIEFLNVVGKPNTYWLLTLSGAPFVDCRMGYFISDSVLLSGDCSRKIYSNNPGIFGPVSL